MSQIPVPVDAKRTDWPRLVANAINGLLKMVYNPQAGQTRYSTDDGLQYYDATDAVWKPVP